MANARTGTAPNRQSAWGTHAARTGHGKSLARAPVLERRRLGAQWRRNRGSEPALDGRLREKEIHTGGNGAKTEQHTGPVNSSGEP
jgi:hypothetical protein